MVDKNRVAGVSFSLHVKAIYAVPKAIIKAITIQLVGIESELFILKFSFCEKYSSDLNNVNNSSIYIYNKYIIIIIYFIKYIL